MTTEKIDAPAATLDGPRLVRLLNRLAKGDDKVDCARDSDALSDLADRVETLIVSGALLDRAETEIRRHGELRIRIDADGGVGVMDSFGNWEHATTLREALSRALPEGGV